MISSIDAAWLIFGCGDVVFSCFVKWWILVCLWMLCESRILVIGGGWARRHQQRSPARGAPRLQPPSQRELVTSVGIRRQYKGSVWSSVLITKLPLFGYPEMQNPSTKFQGICTRFEVVALHRSQISMCLSKLTRNLQISANFQNDIVTEFLPEFPKCSANVSGVLQEFA